MNAIERDSRPVMTDVALPIKLFGIPTTSGRALRALEQESGFMALDDLMTDADDLGPLEAHAQAAVSAYLGFQTFYADLAEVTARVIQECLKRREIKVPSVQYRAKEANSFKRKAAIPLESDPSQPKYRLPLKEITDLAGVRIITHFLETLNEVDHVLSEEFEIVERSNKSEELIEEERFGYQSVHYLVHAKQDRARLAEYARFANSVVEIQVRTILQHAWAEIEHDIQYKSSATIPSEIRRRFMALAGLLEIADREFQDIQNADMKLESHARTMVQRGDLGGIEITPNSLKLFLGKRLGSDGRMSLWSYEWGTKILKKLGFRDLSEVEQSIAPYDDHQISMVAEGSRQGQVSRFELMLLAALGEKFIERHPWRDEWFVNRENLRLNRFRQAGIEIGRYDPQRDAMGGG